MARACTVRNHASLASFQRLDPWVIRQLGEKTQPQGEKTLRFYGQGAATRTPAAALSCNMSKSKAKKN
jgi:hypothetical protein